MIITIDGPVGTGKSVVAKKLAEELGFVFFDTGAMYRSLTYGILKHRIDINQPEQLQKFLDQFKFDLKISRGERHYFFEDEDITKKIRGNEVTLFVSEVSAKKAIRIKLVELQRQLAVGVNAVFEGRDLGTFVFPHADLKIFLTGRDDVRAKRRHQELKVKYPEESKNLTFENCLADINRRDAYDSSREHSPLCKAEDAFVIDTSDLNVEGVVNKILEFKDRLKKKGSLYN
jgi:CMP/dCMP kinase